MQLLVHLYLVAYVISTGLTTTGNKTSNSSTPTTVTALSEDEDCISVWIENWALVFINFKLQSNVPNLCPNAENRTSWTAYFNDRFCIEIPRHAGLLFGRQVIFAPLHPVLGDSSGHSINADGYIKCPEGGHVSYADCFYRRYPGSERHPDCRPVCSRTGLLCVDDILTEH